MTQLTVYLKSDLGSNCVMKFLVLYVRMFDRNLISSAVIGWLVDLNTDGRVSNIS